MAKQPLNKFGVKIKCIKAGSLYETNIGVRDYYSCVDAVMSYSLFSLKYYDNGLRINTKHNFTRDVVCIDFEFGSASYEEQLKKLYNKNKNIDVYKLMNIISKTKKIHYKTTKKINKITFKNKLEDILQLKSNVFPVLCRIYKRRFLYDKKSKKEIRKQYYKDGFDITYYKTIESSKYKLDKSKIVKTIIDRENNKTYIKYVDEIIHYKMLYRTSAQAKQGKVIFINENHYDVMSDWMTMGINKLMPDENAKIVELSAYAPLVTSTIIDTINIPINDVLIVEDIKSVFKTKSKVIISKEYQGKKICDVKDCDFNVTNTLWDGMGLVEDSVFPDYINGFALLRNSFFKMAGFRTYLQKFFIDWCYENNLDYESEQIEDMFGNKHYIKDIKVVTTNNAIKWLKFVDIIGGTKEKAYDYWCDKIKKDDCIFGIVKTDHSSKLGKYQQASYQMINSLPATREDMLNITDDIKEYINKLKNNNDEFINYLRLKANLSNNYEMLISLYEKNNNIAKSKFFSNERKKIIYAYIHEIQTGKLIMEADNLTVCGNPYSLLLYITKQDYLNDPTLKRENGTIQCYTSKFNNDEFLCAFRSPQNSYNNVMYLHNIHAKDNKGNIIMKKYFNFSDNIMAVNCIETDVQERANSEDFDSDFNYVTNNKTAVKLAKICYDEYPTVVNNISESGITYNNTPTAYAEMDEKFAKSKMGIGESSNIAQLAMTYYFTEKLKDEPDEDKLKTYYNIFVEMAVIAQIIIDGCKREYDIDAQYEIRRARENKFMALFKPNFWKYINISNKKDEDITLIPFEEYEKSLLQIKEDKIAKLKSDFINNITERRLKFSTNGKELTNNAIEKTRNVYNKKIELTSAKIDNDISNSKFYYDNVYPNLFVEKGFIINSSLECPMNYAIEYLETINSKDRCRTIPTINFFIKNTTSDTNRHQISKITEFCKEYYDEFNSIKMKMSNSAMTKDDISDYNSLLVLNLNNFIDKIDNIKLNKKTVNRLVECALELDRLGYNNSKYSKLILMTLYKTNKKSFLECFKDG